MTGLEGSEQALEDNITNPWVITSIVVVVLVTIGLIYSCAKKDPKIDKDDHF